MSGLNQLGHVTTLPATPEAAILERVPAPHAGKAYLVRFAAPEFTSLCPITAQPDFAHIVIDYVPDAWIVESKSLKLFLGSFRNHGAFHEDCTLQIAGRLVDLLAPVWLRIGAYWYPRGGIPIDVFWQTDTPPEGVWVPDQGVAPYRGGVGTLTASCAATKLPAQTCDMPHQAALASGGPLPKKILRHLWAPGAVDLM